MKTRAFRAESFLLLTTAAAALSFAVWDVLLNNFVIEQAAFTGREIGILQSLREVPGFLAFTTVFVLLVIKEQNFALVSLLLLGLGVSLTGYLPSEYGLYFTTVLMSTGFHYFYTVQQSLTLQWFDAARTPLVLGRLSAATSYASLLGFALVWLCMEWLDLGYVFLYVLAGGAATLVAVLAWRLFPRYEQTVPQHKHLLMRKRYWLYYGLTFLSGARRQIFIVFATFLMVEKFGYSAAEIAMLYILNHSINTLLAPRIGRFVAYFGERLTLTIEYLGLICIFSAYAFVETAWIAAVLFVVDHIFYAMAIAIRSYFKKIADPADMASTASVAFTINHIAAVIIPVSFGLLWMVNPAAVFLAGAGLAGCSLVLARLVPRHPEAGNEVHRLREPVGEHS
ncbi:MAG TPA: MFS transporter [Xanthomonadales bacterium]|nr:MFS transporter [Xanthomonadales bacterium]